MNRGERTILRVGLTGNIGAGKSTVGTILEAGGCLRVDADSLGHAVLRQPEVREQLVAAFGGGIVGDDGRIDRTALGRAVFSDAAARRRLEAITHPRIRALEEATIEAWPVKRGIAVTEAALLVETGSAARYDRLVVVSAPAAARLRRLVRRGVQEADARRRMAAQMEPEAKAAHADYLIDNGGDRETTRLRVTELLGSLTADLERLSAGLSLKPQGPRRET